MLENTAHNFAGTDRCDLLAALFHTAPVQNWLVKHVTGILSKLWAPLSG